DNVKNEVRTIVAHAGDGTKDTEIILARAGAPTLGDRLDGIDAQLAHTAKLSDLEETNAVVAQKANTNYVLALISSVASGAPVDVFNTLADLQAAYPNGASGVFLVLYDGHIYSWNIEENYWQDLG